MTNSTNFERKAAIAGARLFLKLRKAALVATAGRGSSLGPPAATASVIIGATLGRVPGLIEQLVDGGPVVVVLEAIADDWAATLGRALQECFRHIARQPPPVNALVPPRRKLGAEARHPASSACPVRVLVGSSRMSEKESKDISESIGDMCSVVAIAHEPSRELPPAVLRAADHRLVACRLDGELLALVVAAVAGSRPKRTLSPDLLRLVDLTDIRLALHRDRGPDGCIERLEQLTKKRLPTQAAVPRLSDLAGYGAARDIGLAIAADLQAYRNGLPWSQIEKGILLFGPPGTGKTLFAKSLAAQAELPLVSGSISLWQSVGEGHLGTLLRAMRKFFEEARALAPSIAFIDEIDAFGGRDRFADRYAQYWTQAVLCLLELLDGTFDRSGVFVIAATNNPDALDPAIVRSGRFDRKIEISLPGYEDLREILRHHLGPDLTDMDLGDAARRMIGGSGADCANVVRRARGTARQAGRHLAAADLITAIGTTRTCSSPEASRRTAVHESGHSIVAQALGLKFGAIGIRGPIPSIRGFAAIDLPEVGTVETCRAVLAVMMAGRAAEVVVLGTPSAGAADDLNRATALAGRMHAAWGLGRWLSVRDPSQNAGRLHSIVEADIRRAFGEACSIVEARRDRLDALVEALLEHQALTGGEVAEILGESLAVGDHIEAPQPPE